MLYSFLFIYHNVFEKYLDYYYMHFGILLFSIKYMTNF
jgi:hypothetical protein